MKIYTKIRIDLRTGKTIEEESFEYFGPMALCWESGGGPDSGPEAGEVGGMGDPGEEGPADLDAGALAGMTSEEYNAWSGATPPTQTMTMEEAIAAFAATTKEEAKAKSTWGNIKNAIKAAWIGLASPVPGGAFLGAIVGYNLNAIKAYVNNVPQAIVETASMMTNEYNVPPEVATQLATQITQENQNAINSGAEGELMAAINTSGLANSIHQGLVKRFSGTKAGEQMDMGKLATSIAKSISGGKDWKQAQMELSGGTVSPMVAQFLSQNYNTWTQTSTDLQTTTDPAAPAPAAPVPGSPEDINKQLAERISTSAPDMTAFNSAMDEFKNVNTDIKFIHDMSELEGVTLSDEEKQFLETMRVNATTNLTNTVNEATLDLAETEIARMVNRGVLQGNIGSETMSKIYEASGKIVGEQSRNIESDVAKMGLGVLEQKKINQMGLWGQELTADIASATIGTDKWKSIGMLELGKAEQTQGWNQNLINALTTMRGQDITMRGQDISLESAKLGAATNLNMAGQEMSAWKSAQDKQFWGNIGSALINAWA